MNRHKIGVLAVSIAFLSILLISGCAPKVGGADYSASGAQKVYLVEYGTVQSVQVVAINSDNPNTAIGTVGGGIVGGIIGNLFGSGAGNTLATIGGAAAGAMAGGAVGQALGSQQGYEVTVTLDSGKTMAVVQGADYTFTVGQRVRISSGGDGKTRVAPF